MNGQINILRKSLIEIFPKEKERNLRRIMLKKVIKKHQKIITFSEHIEDLFSYIAMVLFISDILIICFLGFTIVAVNDFAIFNSAIKRNIYYRNRTVLNLQNRRILICTFNYSSF